MTATAAIGALLLVVLVSCAGAGARGPGAPAAPAAGGAADAAGRQQPPVAQSPAKVRIGLATESLGRTPLYVAQRKGYFAEQGLDVERTSLQGGTALVAAFLSGEVDLAGFGADAVVELVSEGKDIQVIYSMGEGHDLHLVVSKSFAEQRGVEPTLELGERLRRLRGITIGAPSLAGLGEFRSRWLMSQGGLGEQDVTVVQAGGGGGLVAAVENGQVDGFTGSPPLPQEASARGRAVVLVRPSEIRDFPRYLHGFLGTSRAYGERNVDTLHRLAQALNRAKQFIQDSPDEAAQELKRDFPSLRDDVLRESVAFYRPTLGTDGKMTVESWRDTLEFLKAGGIVKGEANPAEGVYWTNKYHP
jgi:NitT/TauT family transport system substrate-binding protein